MSNKSWQLTRPTSHFLWLYTGCTSERCILVSACRALTRAWWSSLLMIYFMKNIHEPTAFTIPPTPQKTSWQIPFNSSWTIQLWWHLWVQPLQWSMKIHGCRDPFYTVFFSTINFPCRSSPISAICKRVWMPAKNHEIFRGPQACPRPMSRALRNYHATSIYVSCYIMLVAKVKKQKSLQ